MSALVCDDGAVFTWGPTGKYGQLGHGDLDRNLSPKQVVDLINHVVVMYLHMCRCLLLAH